jgi:hypothetical protein
MIMTTMIMNPVGGYQKARKPMLEYAPYIVLGVVIAFVIWVAAPSWKVDVAGWEIRRKPPVRRKKTQRRRRSYHR